MRFWGGSTGWLARLGGEDVILVSQGKIKIGKVIQAGKVNSWPRIANIGDSMLEKKSINREKEKEDIRALGLVMVELMEPDTSMLYPDSLSLQRPEEWRDNTGIKEFLAATEISSLEDLRKVGFNFEFSLYPTI